MSNVRTRQPRLFWSVSRHSPLAIGHFLSVIFHFLVSIFCACSAFALNPSLDISQYAHTSWKVREGFVRGRINAIAQTPDGYLWLGTEFGLYRFDGVRALPWQAPHGDQLPGGSVRTILVARDGTLWIGTDEGLASWKDGKLVRHAELGPGAVYSLLEDREGTIWTGGEEYESQSGKLCQVRTNGTQCYVQELGNAVGSMYEDRNGNVWVSTTNGLWHWKPGPPRKYAVPASLSIIEEDDGALLIGGRNGITRFANGKAEPYSPPGASRLPLRNPILFRDRDGGVWIATINNGLLHVHEGRTDLFTESDGLSGEFLTAIFEDREGGIWVAGATGLDRFRELAVPTISVKQGLSNATVSSVFAARDGSVWVGTVDGLNRWKNGEAAIYRKSRSRAVGPSLPSLHREVADPGLPSDDIESVLEDDHGRVWVSTATGLAYFEKGRFIPVRAVPGRFVVSISEDSRENLWIVHHSKGLFRLADGRVVEEVPLGRLAHRGPRSAMCDRTESGIWLGFRGGGVVRFEDGQVRASYSADNGLGAGDVEHLRFGPRGALWAATENGLSRIKDGHIATLTNKNGLPCDAVHWTTEDDEHSMWLYTRCGLVRIARSQLDAWASDPKRTVQVSLFDTSDGVPVHLRPPTGYSPTVSKSADGRIWFATGDGVGVVDPHHLAHNKLPPPVHIEQVTADGKAFDASNGVRLPRLVRYVDIDYTALSLVVPEKVRFRVKLEGQDKDWRELVNVRRVSYTNLGPKHYRFLVKACNNSGVWNEEGAALDFVIPPAWYQTSWFLAACVAAFLALLWALYQYRLHQLAHQFNMRLEARVGERTLIARDLHDTLLQSFHGVLLFLQSGIHLMPEQPAEGMKTLKTAAEQAERAIIEGREAVQGLRASTVERNDLALAIKTLGSELAAANSNSHRAEFNVQVEGIPRELHPILRDEVFRIGGEAMRNAFRHSDAKQIEVEIRYDERQLRLRVRDDGKGIDPKLLSHDGREGHFGLRGMRERAKLIGGKLTVWSELDSGTEVELSIPASRAYTAPGDGQRSWLAEKFAKFSRKDTELKS